jgi:hypothetical protein
MTSVLLVALAGSALLVVAAIYLLCMNWNNDMWPRLISAIGIGSITFLVAVLSTLQSSREEIGFSSVVVFDKTDSRPPFVEGDPDRADVQRLQALNSLSLDVEAPPDEQTFAFCAELLQYKLLVDLRDIQRAGSGLIMAAGRSRLHVIPAPTIVKLPDQSEVLPSQIRGYDSNRFSKTQRAALGWQIGGLRVPRNTKVEIDNNPGSARYVIRLLREGYFTFEITIVPAIGAEVARLPDGIRLVDETRPHSLSIKPFDVTITSQFDTLTSGNWRTQHYKSWVKWLMSELSRKNAEG